jgi:hypothetical protein
VQTFASGEAKVCHQVANQIFAKIAIARQDGTGL